MESTLGSWSADSGLRGLNFPLLKKNEAVEPNSKVHLYLEDHHLIVGASDFDKDISQEDYSMFFQMEETPSPLVEDRVESIKDISKSNKNV